MLTLDYSLNETCQCTVLFLLAQFLLSFRMKIIVTIKSKYHLYRGLAEAIKSKYHLYRGLAKDTAHMRRPGIEPRANAWKAFMLPLHHRRCCTCVNYGNIRYNRFDTGDYLNFDSEPYPYQILSRCTSPSATLVHLWLKSSLLN